ncbi:MAG: hydantoinase B/oxoprolinase family protein [Armatimonadetes bacterium]|nr:hydantoinase B/oxoprolinase family protein [Armatimonadota bacterium]
MRRTVAPLTLEVFWSRLISVVEEQAAALIRTSFTPAVSECGDLSACAFDARGRLIAQAITGTPGHINPMAAAMRHILAEFPPETLAPGDVIITNDPWKTSGHFHDITVVSPVFRGDRLIGFFGNICHTADIGGRVFSADAQELYEEGLFIPVVKLMQGGRNSRDVERFLVANVRTPEELMGDLYAQMAANEVGAQRLLGFMAEYGLEDIEDLAEEVIRRSEHAMRTAIAPLPDGTYESEATVDGYDEPVTLRVRLVVRGDEILVDHSGTSPQSRRGINVVLNYTHAYATFALKCALAPDVPNNEGSFRPIQVTAPEGCILNATPPAPVAGRHILGHFLPALIFRALAPVIPERVMAEGSANLWNTSFHGLDAAGRRFTLLFFNTGGTGARHAKDGLSSTAYPSGVAGTPAEVIEARTPLVVVKRELRTDAGGPGTYRGGLGHWLVLRVARTPHPVTFSPFFDRLQFPARGLMGGLEGAKGEYYLSDGRRPNPKATISVPPGVDIVIGFPGGGGVGDPRKRPREKVLDDVRNGYVSPEAARDIYGAAADPTTIE